MLTLRSLNLWNACQIYFVECVSKIKHIFSVIHYTIYVTLCFQFTHFPWFREYTLRLIAIIKSEVWTIIHCLTHWGRLTHICVSKLTIIASDNGLSPVRRQAIIWTHAEILLIGTLGTNFSEILIEILTFSFTKMRLKVYFIDFCYEDVQLTNHIAIFNVQLSYVDINKGSE